MELSPGSLRAFVVGTSYQLGNLASSASSTIEATIGEKFPLPPKIEANGKKVPRDEYGKGKRFFLPCSQKTGLTYCHSHLHFHGLRLCLRDSAHFARS